MPIRDKVDREEGVAEASGFYIGGNLRYLNLCIPLAGEWVNADGPRIS